MSLSKIQNLPTDQQETLLSLYWGCGSILESVFHAAAELNLFEIISKASGGAADNGSSCNNGAADHHHADHHLISAAEIASHLPTKNEKAPEIVDRMLLLLASHSVVKCKVVYEDGGKVVKRLYGLTPLSKCLLPDEHGNSRAPHVALINNSTWANSGRYLKDAVLEGVSPFEKANNGVNLYDYMGKDRKFGVIFDDAMKSMSTNFMIEILESYKGFENVKVLVDVGGGVGSTLDMIISKYPSIKGINFDLPHVIKKAPAWPGVEHVEGNMFESVPKGDAVIIKRTLHDWCDEMCIKILKNCFKALPDNGKVIAIEVIAPESPEGISFSSRLALTLDMRAFTYAPQGNARTEKQYESLAKSAGFAASIVACQTHEYCAIEFHKTYPKAN